MVYSFKFIIVLFINLELEAISKIYIESFLYFSNGNERHYSIFCVFVLHWVILTNFMQLVS